MSETAEISQPKNRRKATFIIVAVGVISLLVYGSGVIVLPFSILSNYQGKNCSFMLSLHGLYRSLYPTFIEDQTLSDPVMECAVYTLANTDEANEAWQSSYNAYKVYENTYPNGLLVDDAHQHAASALTNLTKEQLSEKKFTNALANLNLILADYSDTDSSQAALDLFPQLYAAWGEDLRNAGRFEEAFGIYKEYKSWAENNQEAEHSKLVQAETAQTYLDWGLQLQSQMKFEEAEGKFQSAISADPTFAEQVKANEAKFHAGWGDFLIEQKDFAGAMEHYGLVAKSVEESDPIAAKDAIANGYIQWARGLSAEEDFIGTLVLLDFAQESAATDALKNSVEEARTATYSAFSMSEGEQAQKAVGDAVALVCKHHTNSRIPIFGTAKDNVLVGLYGIDSNLPGEISAIVPASLHYVVCVEENTKVIGSTKHTLYASSAGFRPYLFERLQYVWIVTMRKTDTGEEVATTIIEGGDPPPFPTTDWEIYTAAFNGSTQYFGQKPDLADLVNWIAGILK